MALQVIDAKLLQKMFLAGAKSIEAKKEYINELNVFPVPDGDTGTNMTLTVMSAAKEAFSLDEPTMESLAKAISSGSLRGARGNSGVILSQLFRGFTKEIKNCTKIDVITASRAFQKAVETAYKAVMKPKEGTILTVAKGGAQRAQELVSETDDLVYFLKEVIEHMEEVLDYTPELLPVLKEAGVVDSGGQGLVEFIKGAYDALLGKEVDFSKVTETISVSSEEIRVRSDQISTADIVFGYCTEFIILLENQFEEKEEGQLQSYLESIGDSIVVVADEDVVKVHVHTNDPGLAIQKALTYGQLTAMKIDNMREEHNEKLILEAKPQKEASNEPRKEFGFVAVSVGNGMNEIFKGLGVDYLLEGGQTMNPSTEDLLNAIAKVNADCVYILPNNKNIILAADQAKYLETDKKVVVIPSCTIPQGIAALINHVAGQPVEENAERMIKEMKLVKTGQLTYAVRDTCMDGKEIKQGDMMGLDDTKIVSSGNQLDQVAFDLIASMVDEDSALISLYYGEEITQEAAETFAAKLQEQYPEVDVEVHYGGQPIYYYVISVE